MKYHYRILQEPEDHAAGGDYMEVDETEIIDIDYIKRIADNLVLLTERIAQLQLEIDAGKASTQPQRQNVELNDDIFAPDSGDRRRTRKRHSGQDNEFRVRVSTGIFYPLTVICRRRYASTLKNDWPSTSKHRLKPGQSPIIPLLRGTTRKLQVCKVPQTAPLS
jgi:hypothetical protein